MVAEVEINRMEAQAISGKAGITAPFNKSGHNLFATPETRAKLGQIAKDLPDLITKWAGMDTILFEKGNIDYKGISKKIDAISDKAKSIDGTDNAITGSTIIVPARAKRFL